MRPINEKGKGSAMAVSREKLPAVLRQFDISYIGLCVPQIWIYCIAHRTDGALGEVELGVPLYLALTLCMGAALLIARRDISAPSVRVLAVPAAVLQGAATVLLVAPASALGVSAPWLFPCAAAVGGAGVAWLYLQWAPFYASLSTKDVVAAVFIAMAVGSALKVPLDMLPAWPAAAILAVLPALSVLLVHRAARCPVAAPASPRLFHEENPTAIPWGILVGVAAYSFVIGAVKAFPDAAAPVPFWLLTLVHHGVEIALAAAMLWWVLVRGRAIRFSALWRAILLFTAAALIFLPVAGPAAEPWILLSAGIAQTLVVMLLWAMLADVAHHAAARPTVIFASGWIAYSLPLAAGELLGWAVAGSEAASLALAAMAYLVTVVAVLALSDAAFSQRRIFADLDVPAPVPAAYAGIEVQCRALGQERGLTAREVEVLQMLAKGRSKSYIAENLFISENTVRSHAKHIYQKLDVHSKQEVLDLLGLKD